MQVEYCIAQAKWCDGCPDQLRKFRHGVTVASSWIHKRFWEEGMTYPWRLCLLADTRIALADRRANALEFLRLPEWMLDEHFSWGLLK